MYGRGLSILSHARGGIGARSLISIDKWKKGRVSRKPGSVVKGCGATLDGGYLSGTPVTRRLKRFFAAELVKDQPWFLRPCTQPGFTEPAPLDAAGALLPHLCTLTINGGMFLWHYPHDRSHWALPSKFGLSGARTFLRQTARVHLQPPPLLFPISSVIPAGSIVLKSGSIFKPASPPEEVNQS